VNTTKKLLGIILAVLLDVGTGLIVARFVSVFVFGSIPAWYHYFVGVLSAVLPDFDTFVPLAIDLVTKRNKLDSSHRNNPMHYPLVMISGTFVVLLFFGFHFWIVVVTCVFVHMVHDSWQSQEIGTWVKWLAPFSKTSWQVLSRERSGAPIQLVLRLGRDRVARRETLEDWLNAIFFKLVDDKIFGLRVKRPTFENSLGILLFFVGLTFFVCDVFLFR